MMSLQAQRWPTLACKDSALQLTTTIANQLPLTLMCVNFDPLIDVCSNVQIERVEVPTSLPKKSNAQLPSHGTIA